MAQAQETTAAADWPGDPIAAVTHADPYGYYAHLVAERPFAHDSAVGLWVASSAAAVAAVLTNPACRVRPADEPIPRALLGTPAGEIFRHLVRMNDGEVHRMHKQAVTATLDAIDLTRVSRESERRAAQLSRSVDPTAAPARLEEFAFALPTSVLASRIGFPEDALPDVVSHVGQLVRCIFPGGTPEQVEQGKVAAAKLRECVRTQLERADRGSADTLLGALAAHVRRTGGDGTDGVIANAIGFMVQAYDATAGLIGATLLALAREPELRQRIAKAPVSLGDVVDEVLRYDAPVQNTRRFVADATTVEGHALRPGDTILVILAAANRDPAANPDPHRFDIARRERRVFTFGVGAHACPGRVIATAIAKAAVAQLLADGFEPERLERRPAYRPSQNSRIPLLEWRGTHVTGPSASTRHLSGANP
jgi:cytochrome P450